MAEQTLTAFMPRANARARLVRTRAPTKATIALTRSRRNDSKHGVKRKRPPRRPSAASSAGLLKHDRDPKGRVGAKRAAVFPRDNGGPRLRGDHAQTIIESAMTMLRHLIALLEHDPEKCAAVFRKDHAQPIT
ncbi:hypothetical protein [Bradyrhizobium zhanjiangense]|uniref:hypothetical protein n=1 Tax=Bradyrhizobium zhanjiangense TaxID=1325107 RepID=UPI0010093928|nr:hypothetical protein [Bradyrhizobium zhanjiangense]